MSRHNDHIDALVYGLECLHMNKLEKKRVELQTKLDKLIELKGLRSEEVLYVSQQLDKVITYMTLVFNNMITQDEYDLYLLFCEVYELDIIEKDSLSRTMMEEIMIHELTKNK